MIKVVNLVTGAVTYLEDGPSSRLTLDSVAAIHPVPGLPNEVTDRVLPPPTLSHSLRSQVAHPFETLLSTSMLPIYSFASPLVPMDPVISSFTRLASKFPSRTPAISTVESHTTPQGILSAGTCPFDPAVGARSHKWCCNGVC